MVNREAYMSAEHGVVVSTGSLQWVCRGLGLGSLHPGSDGNAALYDHSDGNADHSDGNTGTQQLSRCIWTCLL